MITKEDWDSLKQAEHYGMYLSLNCKFEEIEKRIKSLEDKNGRRN